jgi:hypothetical protein
LSRSAERILPSLLLLHRFALFWSRPFRKGATVGALKNSSYVLIAFELSTSNTLRPISLSASTEGHFAYRRIGHCYSEFNCSAIVYGAFRQSPLIATGIEAKAACVRIRTAVWDYCRSGGDSSDSLALKAIAAGEEQLSQLQAELRREAHQANTALLEEMSERVQDQLEG